MLHVHGEARSYIAAYALAFLKIANFALEVPLAEGRCHPQEGKESQLGEGPHVVHSPLRRTPFAT